MSDFFEKWTLRDGLRVVFRRWHLFVISACLFTTAVILWAHTLPLKYTGTAIFERTVDPGADVGKGGGFEEMKRTLTQRLAGREPVEKLIDQLMLDVKPVLTVRFERGVDGELTHRGEIQKQELVADFQKRISVRFDVSSATVDMVSLSFTHEDPELAQRVPNALVTNYMEWVLGRIKSDLVRSQDSLKKEVAKAKQELDKFEAEKAKIELENGDMMPESPTALRSRITSLETDLATLQLQEDKARQTLASLSKLGNGNEEVTQGDDTAPKASEYDLQVDELEGAFVQSHARVADMKDTLGNARLQYTEAHPTVKSIKQNIVSLSKPLDDIDARVAALLSSTPAPSETLRYRLWLIHLGYLKDRLDTYADADIYRVPPKVIESLRNQIATAESSVTTLRAKLPAGYVTKRSTPERPVDQLNVDIAMAQARTDLFVTGKEIERLKGQLEKASKLMQNFTTVRYDYLEILRKIQDQQGELKNWQDKLNGVETTLKAEEASMRTRFDSVQTSQKQYRPSSPKLSMVVGGGVLGGLAFGVGMVLLLNFLDRSIKTTEEASDYFNIPVHGIIGEIITTRQRRQRRAKKLVFGVLAAVVLVIGVGVSLFSISLRLKWPERYKQWTTSPVACVRDITIEMFENEK